MGEGEKEKEKKKEEEKRKIQVWNVHMFGTSPLFGNFGIGNTCLSWVRKTLTFQYMCFWLV